MAVKTPTGRMHLLGSEMQYWRELAGLSQEYVGREVIGKSQTKINHMENGRGGIELTDLEKLLDAYRVPADVRTVVLELTENTSQRGRWKGPRKCITADLRPFVDLEEDAIAIRSVVTEMVNGLLQTPAYARAIIEADEEDRAAQGEQDPEFTAEQYTAARLLRQKVLDPSRSQPTLFQVIMSESSVRREFGSGDVMHDQMNHLLALMQYPNIDIRLVPFKTRGRKGVILPPGLTLFELRHEGLASGPLTVVYRESSGGGSFATDPKKTARDIALFDRILNSALSPEDTAEFLSHVRASHLF